jgi:hypothetical protein
MMTRSVEPVLQHEDDGEEEQQLDLTQQQGRSMARKCFQRPAPSIAAASKISSGMFWRPVLSR